MGSYLHWVYSNSLEEAFDDLSNIARKIHQLNQQIALHEIKIERLFVWLTTNSSYRKSVHGEFPTIFEETLQKQFPYEIDVMMVKEQEHFDGMLIGVDQMMHQLCIHFPFENHLLAINNEDSLCQQAVLIEGVKTFEDHFGTFYLKESAYLKQYEHSHFSSEWFNMFQQLIHHYDFVGAKELLKEFQPSDEIMVVDSLLSIQEYRFNFDFQEAKNRWELISGKVPKDLRLFQLGLILDRAVGADEHHQDLERIQELYRQVKACLMKGDSASFLTRFYRAREAVIRFVLKYGLRKESKTVFSTIYQLIDFLEDQYEDREIQKYYGAYFYTKSSNVGDTLAIRNHSFIGHKRLPIQTKKMYEEYYGTYVDRTSQMTDRFLGDSRIMLYELGGMLDDNIDDVNAFLIEYINDFARRGAAKWQ